MYFDQQLYVIETLTMWFREKFLKKFSSAILNNPILNNYTYVIYYKESVSSEFALRFRGTKYLLLIFAKFIFWGLKIKINQSMYG